MTNHMLTVEPVKRPQPALKTDLRVSDPRMLRGVRRALRGVRRPEQGTSFQSSI